MDTMTQTAPFPVELKELVDACEYRPGWLVLLRDEVRDPSDTHAGETRGLTLSIITETINSYPPHQPMRVRHLFAVPAATYNRESWQRWLFDRFLDVERHECMEFFTVAGEKPYAPNHGPGWDPYLITAVQTTDVDRRTSFRGEVKPPEAAATEVRLCDAAGMVSREPVEPGSHGTEFDPGLTYLGLLNNLRAHTGLSPIAEPFHCTGSAHLAGMVFHCTSPAHEASRRIVDPPRPLNYRPWAG